MANPRRGAFGLALKEARENAGMSQRALAELIGRDPAEVSKWERALADPPKLEVLEKMDAALGTKGQLITSAGYGLMPGDSERIRAVVDRHLRAMMEEITRLFPE